MQWQKIKTHQQKYSILLEDVVGANCVNDDSWNKVYENGKICNYFFENGIHPFIVKSIKNLKKLKTFDWVLTR